VCAPRPEGDGGYGDYNRDNNDRLKQAQAAEEVIIWTCAKFYRAEMEVAVKRAVVCPSHVDHDRGDQRKVSSDQASGPQHRGWPAPGRRILLAHAGPQPDAVGLAVGTGLSVGLGAVAGAVGHLGVGAPLDGGPEDGSTGPWMPGGVTAGVETGHGGGTESPPTSSVEQPGLPELGLELPTPEPPLPEPGLVPRELGAALPGRADGAPL